MLAVDISCMGVLPACETDGLRNFGQRLTMHSRMLPNVERVQPESERPQLADQRVKHPRRQPCAAVFAQTPPHHLQVVQKLLSRPIPPRCERSSRA